MKLQTDHPKTYACPMPGCEWTYTETGSAHTLTNVRMEQEVRGERTAFSFDPSQFIGSVLRFDLVPNRPVVEATEAALWNHIEKDHTLLEWVTACSELSGRVSKYEQIIPRLRAWVEELES